MQGHGGQPRAAPKARSGAAWATTPALYTTLGPARLLNLTDHPVEAGSNSVLSKWSGERSPSGQQGTALGIIVHRINPTMARGEITW